ncbi:MAG: sulfatase-like hydrolase/transferase [Pirellulales bacterium]
MRYVRSVPLSVLVVWITTLTVSAAAPDRAPPAGRKPNIVLLLADDLTYEAVRALGNQQVDTPNIDRLAREGVTFSHAYNQGSWSPAVCVASRHMLVTGRFLWHARAASERAEAERRAGRFWPEYLRRAGYATYMTGKWHIRAAAAAAFDHVRHVRPGMPRQTEAGYHRPIEGKPDVWQPWDTSRGGYYKGGRHWSEVLADDAIAFLDDATNGNRPFFLYLAFNAPHDPRQSPREYVERYRLDEIRIPDNFLAEYPMNEAIGCGRKLRDEMLAPFPRTEFAIRVHRREYYAIITHMDEQIGRILDAIDRTGAAENTYVFFTSDHGLAVGSHGLVGKQSLFDHSLRVPLMVRGPALPAGRRFDGAVYLQDVMPTSLEVAGVECPEHVQFRSLLPIVRGERAANYTSLYGAYLALQRSVIEGDYKLILYPAIRKTLLFYQEHDPLEMHDLAGDPAQQATLRRLFKRLIALQKETGDTLDLVKTYPRLVGG